MKKVLCMIFLSVMYIAIESCHAVDVANPPIETTHDTLAEPTVVHPDNRIEVAVEWAISIAENPAHGYSQGVENATNSHPYTGSREGVDYDCASLVYHALDYAGFDIVSAWKKNPVYWNEYNGQQETGDADTIWPDLQLVGGFTKYEWDEVKDSLKRGDILCNPQYHVAIYIGDGKTVEARGVNNPRGGDWTTGDQGGEIDFYDAYGRTWTEVYRLTK